MARLYSNENFPLPVVLALRERGHDVLTTHDASKSGAAIPDEEVIAFAVTYERAVLTLNRKDFIRLHLQSNHHAGIIVCTFDPDFDAQAERIHRSINQAVTLKGQLIRVNRSG